MVDTLLVGQEIGVDGHLGNDGAVFQDLALDSGLILSETEVNDLIELIVNSAFITAQVIINIALLLFTDIRIAILGDESLSLTPAENSIDITALTTVASLVAIDDFLSGESNLAL